MLPTVCDGCLACNNHKVYLIIAQGILDNRKFSGSNDAKIVARDRHNVVIGKTFEV